MQYLKKEINKLFPLALLCGAIGGILLIVIGNVLTATLWHYLIAYLIVIGTSVTILNRIRYKKDHLSAVVHGYLIYAVMTIIAYLDMIMNADPSFNVPIFGQLGIILGLAVSFGLGVYVVASLFRRKLIS